ncbi:MAG: methylenetetrahydrofolate reductase C-terminal domain-containing protein, partial [Oscillospiraceae bacterium]|nr:methylenetetrahydrofolate reductase C-terminal domain-containing protein [Oscillospiraceae bacterium]
FTTEYICNDENLAVILKPHAAAIEAADTIAVFSCGVGVQTVAAMFPAKRVVACCDTYALPGYQGVTPLDVDCKQCGECFLNLTGGICPLTACSKSLVNGQCGGAKNGKCEVDPNMECGWERIYQKLKKIGRLDAMKCPVQLRNYATDDQAKA